MKLGLSSFCATLLWLGIQGPSLVAANCGASIVPGTTYKENESITSFGKAAALSSAGFTTEWAAGIYKGKVQFETIGKILRYHLEFVNGGTADKKILLAIYKNDIGVNSDKVVNWVAVTAKAGTTGSGCADDAVGILNNGFYRFGLQMT